MISPADSTAARVVAEIEESIQVKKQIIKEQLPVLIEIFQVMLHALQEGNKIVLFGNGGSAADSQHIAAELVNRFRVDRKALPAVALTTDSSVLTAIANDYGFRDVFARQIEAIGHEGDVAVGISTSGNSENVLKAFDTAREMGITTVGLTGANGRKLKERADICLCVPSHSTPRIQEAHITVAHVLCELIEQEVCQDDA
ncbi:MAG: D-sedoheptulose 7-phosphate isomerase [Candidatus Promineifilaceae bacterium]